MNSLFAAIGGTEILVIAGVVLLLFGGTKLPALARGLGQSIKEFKKGARDDDDAKNEAKPVEGSSVKRS